VGVAVVVVLATVFVTVEQGHFKLLDRIAGMYVKGHSSQDLHFARVGNGTPGAPGEGTPGTGTVIVGAGTPNPSGMPYEQGSQVYAGAWHALLLRGAQIE